MQLFKIIMGILSRMIPFTLVRDGKDGEPGKPGPMPHNMGRWDENVEYIKDDYIQPYVWKYQGTKKMYYLLVADKSKGDDPYINNTQGGGNIWRYREEYDLFLARKIQADEIDTANLVAANLKTGTHGPRIEASGSEMKIYGFGEYPNIVLGVNTQGYAVLAYYSNDGQLIYDLGPRGINWGKIKPERWSETKLVGPVTSGDDPNFFDFNLYTNTDSYNGRTYYRYFAGSNPTITIEEKEKENYIYTVEGNFNSKLSDGWYMLEGGPMMSLANNTTAFVRPFGEDGIYQWGGTGVRDIPPIYFRMVMQYKGGQIYKTKYVCWNGTSGADTEIIGP